ncbi:Rv3235 family protein [Streptomyces sp. NPDC006668]|uniref:Rv3235 family protein n=1 Tax=Streptomyces sp. NPDC006668 TaxID=3156903 RepID=UPI0033CF6D86
MHKVMTRAAHTRPGTRPPGRHDTRRPGGAPPRTPGGAPSGTAPGGGRPPGSRASGLSANTRPTDTRPASAPAPTPVPTSASASAQTAAPAPAPARASATPPVPAPPVRRPVPQPRPTDVFADRLLAVLSGQRPVHWMLRHTAGRAYDELARLAEHGPLRTRGTRPVVRDIGYCVPRPGAIEAFARIGAGEQLRAMAFRLEQGTDLRWRCTAVELGGPRPPRAALDDD